jgi:calpain-15
MPELVERIFITKEYNDEGVYRVRLCKDGEWCEVTVDDYFPCFPLAGPFFSRAHNNELWVLLLEKAYAKLHGNYKTLCGGEPHQALMDLTGCPTTSFNLKDTLVKKMY